MPNVEILLSPNIAAAHPPSLGNSDAASAIFFIALAAHPIVETCASVNVPRFFTKLAK